MMEKKICNELLSAMEEHYASTGQKVKKVTIREDVYYRLRNEFFGKDDKKPKSTDKQQINGAELVVAQQDPEWVLS